MFLNKQIFNSNIYICCRNSRIIFGIFNNVILKLLNNNNNNKLILRWVFKIEA